MKTVRAPESLHAPLNPERNSLLDESEHHHGKKRDQKIAMKKFDFCSANTSMFKLR
jgi:hypothetical protein